RMLRDDSPSEISTTRGRETNGRASRVRQAAFPEARFTDLFLARAILGTYAGPHTESSARPSGRLPGASGRGAAGDPPQREGSGAARDPRAAPGARPRARDKLATLLWGGLGGAEARASLRQALFMVRKALPGLSLLVIEGDSVALDPAVVEIDLVQFERRV